MSQRVEERGYGRPVEEAHYVHKVENPPEAGPEVGRVFAVVTSMVPRPPRKAGLVALHTALQSRPSRNFWRLP